MSAVDLGDVVDFRMARENRLRRAGISVELEGDSGWVVTNTNTGEIIDIHHHESTARLCADNEARDIVTQRRACERAIGRARWSS